MCVGTGIKTFDSLDGNSRTFLIKLVDLTNLIILQIFDDINGIHFADICLYT